MELVTVLVAVACVLALAYLYTSFRCSYWKRRGVRGPRPWPFMGNLGTMMFGKKSFPEYIRDLTADYLDVGYCGIYFMNTPLLAVWEPEMVKQIFTKDFSSFHDRGQPYDEVNDPLSAHLFNLEGAKWRNLRIKLTPTFTSGKLKLMFPLMKEVADDLCDAVTRDIKEEIEVDVSSQLSRFACDLIGTCAFGVQTHTLRDKSNEFLIMVKQLTGKSLGTLVRMLLSMLHPKLARMMPMKWVFARINNFFITMMRDTVEYREKYNMERPDFVQLMMQLRGGIVDADHIELTPGVMAAQASIFFFAGMDNVSNTVGFCLHHLAVDQDLQEKVALEVREALRATGGEVSYEALKQMQLVEGVICEAMRLWTPSSLLVRLCNATTRVGDVEVEKGVAVIVLTDHIHHNAHYFPEPERFDPGRHNPEAKAMRHPFTYLPFGEGPRVCIAERFVMLEMKLALALLLRDFTFSRGPNYEDNPKMDPNSVFPRPINGFRVAVQRRQI